MDVEECGSWNAHVGFWTLHGFVCASLVGGSLQGDECQLGGGR